MAPRSRATDASTERRLLAIITVSCGLLIAGAVTLPILVGAGPRAPGVAFGDVSEAHIVEIRDGGGTTLLTGEFRSRVDALGNIEKDAALSDRRGRRVIGEVELEIPARGRADRRTEIEVDVMGLPPRATLHLAIDDRVVASFQTDDWGSFDREVREGEIASADPF